jgi:hypothetical protein
VTGAADRNEHRQAADFSEKALICGQSDTDEKSSWMEEQTQFACVSRFKYEPSADLGSCFKTAMKFFVVQRHSVLPLPPDPFPHTFAAVYRKQQYTMGGVDEVHSNYVGAILAGVRLHRHGPGDH